MQQSENQKAALTLLEPQSRFGSKPVKFQIVCPQNGTAVLKGLTSVKKQKTREGMAPNEFALMVQTRH